MLEFSRNTSMPKGYTKEQLNLLYWNTWALHRGAQAIKDESEKMKLPLASPQEISLSAVATMNLALSLELLLKYIIARSGHKYPHGHSLAGLYACMPGSLKHDLSTTYDYYLRDNVKEDIFKATLWSPSEPSAPPEFDISTI